MRISIPREAHTEALVAVTPAAVERLIALGYDVAVEAGAGEGAQLSDADYEAAGASIVDAAVGWDADVVVTIHGVDADALDRIRPGTVLIGMMAPQRRSDLLEDLAARDITGLALDAVPRITRAQSLDVLSTLSNIAGYRAVIEAAGAYGGMFAGQVTAAGKTPPARVFVIGGGVAGLAAIGAAVSLGAQVRACDVRPEAAEQIESMGATFVRAEGAQQQVSADGYASALSEEQERLTQELYAREAAQADIVITTALVRGSAPITLTAATVDSMRAGSVIVDLAASGGGNSEATVPGEHLVTAGGVTVLGWTDLPSRMPRHTSQLLGTNIVNVISLLTPGKDGTVVLDLDDQVVRGMTVAHAGDVLWPPPPVQVSAAPTGVEAGAGGADASGDDAGNAAPAPVSTPEQRKAEREARLSADAAARRIGERAPAWWGRHRRAWLTGIAGTALAVALAFTSPAFLAAFTVFVLAIVVGYYVIFKVTHALHTPLMSQTNAISGIILVGALLQLGSASVTVTVLAFVAAAIASVNVFGGFLVTYRMLGMFQKGA